MSEPLPLKKTRRNLPHWTLDGSVYFVTFRLLEGVLVPAERVLVLDHVKAGRGTFYALLAAVVMPDHVHIILKPNPGFNLSRIMKGMKGASSRLVNEARGAKGRLWQ